MMTIRTAVQKDAQVLDELLVQLIQEEANWDKNLEDHPHIMGSAIQRMVQDGSCYLVAEEGGEIQGFLYGFSYHQPFHRDSIAILDSLFVLPQYRQRGCGKGLIQEFMKFARAEGAAYVELKVLSGNISAQIFYGKLAFTELNRCLRLEL